MKMADKPHLGIAARSAYAYLSLGVVSLVAVVPSPASAVVVSSDLCDAPNLIVAVRVVREEPSFVEPQRGWTATASPNVPLRVFTPYWVRVERTVVGKRHSALLLERTGGRYAGQEGVFSEALRDPVFDVGDRYLLAMYLDPNHPVLKRPQFYGYTKLPEEGLLPPDDVLYATWKTVCALNPWGIPPYGRRSPSTHERLVSPIASQYPEPNELASLPAREWTPETVDLRVTLRLPSWLVLPPGLLSQIESGYGVAVETYYDPAAAKAEPDRRPPIAQPHTPTPDGHAPKKLPSPEGGQ